MADLEAKIREIICKPQLVSLSTITLDGRPWSRYMMGWGQNDFSIRFASKLSARKVAQIEANPEVHINCGVNSLEEMRPYLQIQGRAKLDTSAETKKEFWFPVLANIFEGPGDPNYGVIRVEPYRIEYWNPGKFEPDVWEKTE